MYRLRHVINYLFLIEVVEEKTISNWQLLKINGFKGEKCTKGYTIF